MPAATGNRRRRRAADRLARTACALAAPAVLAIGCAGPRPRFDDGPVVDRVVDDLDVGDVAGFEWWRHPQLVRNFGRDQLRLRLDPVGAGPARDPNRLGEVPSSSWWEDRRDRWNPAAVAAGPAGDDPGPEAHKPWTIVGLKSGGRNPGFLFADSRGVRHIGKFDKVGAPETATGSGAVAARLFWALGYHVPDDRVVIFRRDELRIDPAATRRTEDGDREPLTDAMIDEVLASVPARTPDGSFRALASRFLSGRPAGGYAYGGTNPEDPNDVIDHRDRRSLRALRVFGAWLNHVDLKRDNSLDVVVEEEGRRFLRHYLVDFDGCLGGYWAARHEARIGFAYEFDLVELATGIPRLGLAPRPYERLGAPEHPTVGLFESDVYDPATWRANYLNDHLLACRPADAFWAGTILAGITDEMIRAAAEASRFRDPAAIDVLARVLRERRRETLAWALTQVTPVVGLGDPRGEGADLVFPAADALERAGLAPLPTLRVDVRDGDDRALAGEIRPAEGPRVRVAAAALARARYAVVRWRGEDAAGRELPPTEGHYRRGKDGAWRLVGVLRDGE